MNKVTLTIDDQEIVSEKETTILQAALQNDIYIPHLCYHPDLNPSGVCRLCMVDVDGKVVMSCQTPVEEGMAVKVRSPEVDSIRRTNIEILVADRHLKCRGCPGSGPCKLQKIMGFIRIDRKRVRRLRLPDEELPVDSSNPFFDYDPNHCVLCDICVHICEPIQHAMNVVGRGYGARVAFYGDSSKCEACMACVAACPVGALTASKDSVSQKK